MDDFVSWSNNVVLLDRRGPQHSCQYMLSISSFSQANGQKALKLVYFVYGPIMHMSCTIISGELSKLQSFATFSTVTGGIFEFCQPLHMYVTP